MLEINIEKHNNISIFHLSGEFDIKAVKKAKTVWDNQVSENPDIIAIDCKNLERIDSSGIGTLVQFLNNAKQNKIKLIIYNTNKNTEPIFTAAKLDKFFQITTQDEFEESYLNKHQ